MNEATFFRLLVRAIGVLLVALGAPSVFSLIAWLLQALSEHGAMARPGEYLRIALYVPAYTI